MSWMAIDNNALAAATSTPETPLEQVARSMFYGLAVGKASRQVVAAAAAAVTRSLGGVGTKAERENNTAVLRRIWRDSLGGVEAREDEPLWGLGQACPRAECGLGSSLALFWAIPALESSPRERGFGRPLDFLGDQ